MLKLQSKFLSNKDAMAALHKIFNSDKLRPNTAYRAGRLVEKCNRQMKVLHGLNVELIKKFAKKNEKGETIGFPNGPFEFADGQEDLYNKEMAKLGETEFEEKVLPIPMEELEKLEPKLTPAEIIAIHQVVDGIEE